MYFNKVITYEEQLREGTGSLVISGLVFPENPSSFDPLGKIWSSVRKRIAETYGVQVTGLFFYQPEREIIIANFLLSTAGMEDIDYNVLEKRFRDTFALQMSLFRDTIETFLLDTTEGYLAYCGYLELTEDSPKKVKEECDKAFNSFLLRIGVKTEKDEKEKAKKAKLQPTKNPLI